MAYNRLDNAYENGTLDSGGTVITLSGAFTGFQSFADAGAVDATVYYCKVYQSNNHLKWGYYPCTYAAAGTLTLGTKHHGPGGIDAGAAVRAFQGIHADVLDALETHVASDGTDHTFIDQAVTQAASPSFAGLDLTNITDNYVPYIGASGAADSPIQIDGTNVGIGTAPGSYKFNLNGTSYFADNLRIFGQMFQHTGLDASYPVLKVESNSNTSWHGADYRLIRRRGTSASPLAVASGDYVFNFNAKGYDGSSDVSAGSMLCEVDGTVSTGVVPGRWRWYTRNTSGANAERMRLTSDGDLCIGTNSSSGYKLYVNGTTYIATSLDIAGTTAVSSILDQDDMSSDSAAALATQQSIKAYTDAEALAAKAGRKNLIINGNFDWWQRGTSTTSNAYLADRWQYLSATSTHTVSQQAFTVGQTDVPGEPEFYHRAVVTSGSTAGSYSYLIQKLEDVRTAAGQTITLSFYAKADASKDLAFELYQSFGSGGSATVTGIIVETCSLTTSWQKFTVTGAVSSISGKTVGTDSHVALIWWLDAGSDFNARTNSLGNQSGTFDIAQVQVEIGDQATAFEFRHKEEELALCQRYYQKGNLYVEERTLFSGDVTNASTYYANREFNVSMRAAPTVSLTHAIASGFAASSGTVYARSQIGFDEARVCNSTVSGGYFSSDWTADAEL